MRPDRPALTHKQPLHRHLPAEKCPGWIHDAAGAMGLFIFGLYLGSWLGERKALACEPPQDMIV